LTGVLEDKHYLREQWEQSGWKVVKDYVESQGISPSRPVVKTVEYTDDKEWIHVV
jgi:hypothetical protein